MKRERALGIGLKLLGLAFSIGPLLIAFSMNGWDVQATLLDAEGFGSFENKVSGLFGEGESGGGMKIDEANIEYDNTTKIARVPVIISMPLAFPIDLTEFTLTGTAGGQEVNLSMEEDKITLTPGENSTIHLSGTVDVDPSTTNLEQVSGTITLEKYGVSIKMIIQEGNL